MDEWLIGDEPQRDSAAVDAVLAEAQEARLLADTAQRSLFSSAARWCELHTTTRRADAATWAGTDQQLSLGGQGCPLVSESGVIEFGAALGMSTESARALLADALEVSHRLPDLWKAIESGKVAVWRARRIAQATMSLNEPAAWFVDRHVAPVANKMGLAQLERIIGQARALYDCGGLQDEQLDASDARGVWVGDQVSVGGTVDVRASLEIADAIDFDAAVSQGAALLSRLGSLESLDARRAQAVGDLARRQLALELVGEDSVGQPVSVPSRPATQIYLHLFQRGEQPAPDHAHDPWETPSVPRSPSTVFEVGNRGGGVIDLEALVGWCDRPGARVRVTPVMDLAAHRQTPGYVPPRLLAQQVALRDECCVFPSCSRRARPLSDRLDCDHVHPYDSGGATCSCNLASLCRRHHRAKTSLGWSYEPLDLGAWLWRSPTGRRYVVRDGVTTDVSTRAGCRVLSASGPTSAPADTFG